VGAELLKGKNRPKLLKGGRQIGKKASSQDVKVPKKGGERKFTVWILSRWAIRSEGARR